MLTINILKQITPERVKEEIENIQKMELPREIEMWIKEYEKVGERDEFVWKLFLKAKKNTDFVMPAEINRRALR